MPFTNARTGETAATGAGLSRGFLGRDGGGWTERGSDRADEQYSYTSKSGKSGSSGRRRSGGRKAGGGGFFGRQQHDGGRAHGHGEYTVRTKARMYESFGAGYNPFPLTNSFEWGGERVSLSGEEMGASSGLSDAYMDMYMRERQQEWDGSDSAGRETMLREMDERARDAAYQHLREVG